MRGYSSDEEIAKGFEKLCMTATSTSVGSSADTMVAHEIIEEVEQDTTNVHDRDEGEFPHDERSIDN